MAHDYTASQTVSSALIHFTLPADDRIRRQIVSITWSGNQELADTVNKEILALVDAGCRYIQVDEPLFARQVQDALDLILRLERCFQNS